MPKIVINNCYGGFGLSEKAILRYAELKGIPLTIKEKEDRWLNHYYTPDGEYFSYSKIARDDPILVQVVEELGKEADGEYAELSVVEIPDGVNWVIHDYDGIESIHEQHRVWS